jgi:hypothetical protein
VPGDDSADGLERYLVRGLADDQAIGFVAVF